jgi:hypothetical protein
VLHTEDGSGFRISSGKQKITFRFCSRKLTPGSKGKIQHFFYKYSKKMALFVQYFISCKQLYIFRVKHSPVIRSLNKL